MPPSQREKWRKEPERALRRPSPENYETRKMERNLNKVCSPDGTAGVGDIDHEMYLMSWQLWFVCLAGPPLKPAAVQKRTGYGSILHYIYKSTLGQSLHSRMRQVRLHSKTGQRDQRRALITLWIKIYYYIVLLRLLVCGSGQVFHMQYYYCRWLCKCAWCRPVSTSCRNIFMVRLSCYNAVRFTGVKMSFLWWPLFLLFLYMRKVFSYRTWF